MATRKRATGTGPNLRAVDKNTASEAGRALGSIKTEKKIATATANLRNVKERYRPPEKNPLELPCTCGAGTETEIGEGHKTTCPRGRLLWQRARNAAKKQAAAA